MANYQSTHTGQEHDAYCTKSQLINLVYPVGSIYMSINSTSPQTLFGGTWQQISDTFLLAAGGTYTAGSTGGNAAHTHTLENGFAQIVFHGAGNIRYRELSGKPSWQANYKATVSNVGSETFSETWGAGLAGSTDSTSNLPPYLAVYVWKRTA